MSIENSEVIDGIGTSKDSGDVVLLISDHLTWDDEPGHFSMLERKIGKYVQFTMSPQLVVAVPDARARRVRIELVCQHRPTELAERFLVAAAEQLKGMDLGFSCRELPEGY
jgi:hypothetical protein